MRFAFTSTRKHLGPTGSESASTSDGRSTSCTRSQRARVSRAAIVWRNQRHLTAWRRRRSEVDYAPLPVQRLHHLGVAGQLGGASGEDDLAAVDGVEPVGDATGVLHVGFGDEHGDAEGLDGAHRLDEARDDDRRQPLERLVGADGQRDRAEDLRGAAIGLDPLQLEHRCGRSHYLPPWEGRGGSGVPISVVSTFSSRRIWSGVPSARIVPWCMATIRSEYENTTSMSCSMMAAEMPSDLTTDTIVSMMGAFSRVPTPLVGSSRKSSLGFSA